MQKSSDFVRKIQVANAEMRLRNMFHNIAWMKQSTNEYFFDQTAETVKYFVEENGYEVTASPSILGTFNLEDNTFLWSDENPSINNNLNNKVNAFRQTLPEKYQIRKFESDVDFIKDLLIVFSLHINANTYDYQRQEETIIFYSLMDIKVEKEGVEQFTLDAGNHIKLQEGKYLIETLKHFNEKKYEVDKMYHEKLLDADQAFKKMEAIHLEYWLNEDNYFYPSLSWPSDYDKGKTIEWKAFTTNDNRSFVMYTMDKGWTMSCLAYEIDPKASGQKMIIGEFYT